MSALRRSLVGTVLVLLAAQLAAQDKPVSICVTSRSVDLLAQPARDLAVALSEQKLRSGRVISALPLQDISSSDLSRKVQSAGCDYVVNLWPWRDQPVAPARDLAFNGSEPAQSWPADHRGLDSPRLNYQLLKVDQSHPIGGGTESSHRVYTGYFRNYTYRVDYSQFASEIARRLRL